MNSNKEAGIVMQACVRIWGGWTPQVAKARLLGLMTPSLRQRYRKTSIPSCLSGTTYFRKNLRNGSSIAAGWIGLDNILYLYFISISYYDFSMFLIKSYIGYAAITGGPEKSAVRTGHFFELHRYSPN
ncbi:hypothetical protein EN837_17800 [bacterium M00.F.Ca.ET.194.01.1.1]|nr:hypothetical protein EN837_17800 [bacterium M00.F.Ca.ET.194.01.1.1]TGS53459.1 hypothetical protein EN822_17795 [bacterium M00.F.Ca.ET.179.01.1.1]